MKKEEGRLKGFFKSGKKAEGHGEWDYPDWEESDWENKDPNEKKGGSETSEKAGGEESVDVDDLRRTIEGLKAEIEKKDEKISRLESMNSRLYGYLNVIMRNVSGLDLDDLRSVI